MHIYIIILFKWNEVTKSVHQSGQQAEGDQYRLGQIWWHCCSVGSLKNTLAFLEALDHVYVAPAGMHIHLNCSGGRLQRRQHDGWHPMNMRIASAIDWSVPFFSA